MKRKKISTLVVAALIMTTAMFIGSTATAQGKGFNITPLLADSEWNNPTSIAVDSDGFMHMAYMKQHDTDSATKDIWYATDVSGSWTHTLLTINNVREEFPHLVLDAAGNVHIAFHTGTATSNMIRYVNNVGVAPGSPPGTFNPIIDITGSGFKIVKHAVDSGGKVHFTFTSQTSNFTDEVFYTTWDQVNGVSPLANLSNSAGSETANDIAIDAQDHAHVVFADGSISGPLVYMTNASGAWTTVPTTAAGSVQSPIVLIGPGDVVNIVYRLSDVLYVIDDGGTGVFGPPVPIYNAQTYRPSFYNRFAIDEAGHRHIAFASNVGDLRGIVYIEETESGFLPPRQLSTTVSGNQGVSVALNHSGKVAVSYSISGFDAGASLVYADISLAVREPTPDCPADIAGNDGIVNVTDLLLVITNWGPCPPAPGECIADINGNENVDVSDLLQVITNWGACP